MSAWTEARDAAYKQLGIPVVDLNQAPKAPDAKAAGTAAGNGILELGTNALSSIFRPNAAGTAATGAVTPTAAKVSVGVIFLVAAAAYLLLRKRK